MTDSSSLLKRPDILTIADYVNFREQEDRFIDMDGNPMESLNYLMEFNEHVKDEIDNITYIQVESSEMRLTNASSRAWNTEAKLPKIVE